VAGRPGGQGVGRSPAAGHREAQEEDQEAARSRAGHPEAAGIHRAPVLAAVDNRLPAEHPEAVRSQGAAEEGLPGEARSRAAVLPAEGHRGEVPGEGAPPEEVRSPAGAHPEEVPREEVQNRAEAHRGALPLEGQSPAAAPAQPPAGGLHTRSIAGFREGWGLRSAGSSSSLPRHLVAGMGPSTSWRLQRQEHSVADPREINKHWPNLGISSHSGGRDMDAKSAPLREKRARRSRGRSALGGRAGAV